MISKINKFLSLSFLKKILLFKNFILVPLYYLLFIFKKLFLQRIKSYKDFENRHNYPNYLQFGYAARYIAPIAEIYCKGRGLDIGGGSTPFKNSKNIDPDFFDLKENAYEIFEENNSQDYIFSSHCMEHLERPFKALREFKRVLKHNGIIFLYLPHPGNELWLKENLNFHLWQPTPKKLLRMFKALNIEVVDKSFSADAYHSFYLVGKVKYD
jgi:SAM-dependent methyltransferase